MRLVWLYRVQCPNVFIEKNGILTFIYSTYLKIKFYYFVYLITIFTRKFQAIIILMIVISSLQHEICANKTRDKRSFPWPSFLHGNGITPIASANISKAEHQKIQQLQSDKQQVYLQQLHQIDIQNVQDLQQKAYATPRFTTHEQLLHNPNNPYQQYPMWLIQKYNGFDLKPIPVSLLSANLQSSLLTNNSPIHHSADSASPIYQAEVDAKRTKYDIPTSSERIEKTIPAELQKLAISFGIQNLSKLPSLDEAMNLLGATTPEETISIIKELASTENGKEMIKQFMQSSDIDADIKLESDQQKLHQKTQQKQIQLTEDQQHLVGHHHQNQNQLIQQQQLQHKQQRQPDDHQYMNRHYGPTFTSINGHPHIRHPNQLLQPPTFRTTVGAGFQHANTNHGHFQNVVKPAITDFVLPSSAKANLIQFKKSADSPTLIPAQAIRHSYQHLLNPTFQVQQQQHFQTQDKSELHLEHHNPVVNISSMRTIPIHSVNNLKKTIIEGFNGPLPTPPYVRIPQNLHLPTEKQNVRNNSLQFLNPIPKIHSIEHSLDELVTIRNGNESQLPLNNYTASQVKTPYEIPAHSTYFDDDLDGAASEQISSVVSIPISNEVETQKDVKKDTYRMGKGKSEIGTHSIKEVEGFFIQQGISNKPQRISSYDSYATGKINRADAEAMRIAIPTQTPQAASTIR